MDRQIIQQATERLRQIPRLSMGFYPTPVEELPRLREAIGFGPRLLIKRDDYTGVCFGGNRVRELEFLLGRAVTEGREAVITSGVAKSDLARLTAAMCARLGLRCIVVLSPAEHPNTVTPLKPASLYLTEMLGAEVHLTDGREERIAVVSEIVDQMRRDGARIFEIPLGGATAYGALGFVEAARETAAQIQNAGLDITHIFQASQTGGTHAGLAVGCKLFGLEHVRLIGVSPDGPAPAVASEVKRLAGEVCVLLGLPLDVLADTITVLDGCVGPGYGISTPASEAAVNLLARAEGIFLDPVYTAKAMVALTEWVRERKLTENDTVLFWHTGGQMAFFYAPC